VEGIVISQRKGRPAACKREEEISQVRNHAGLLGERKPCCMQTGGSILLGCKASFEILAEGNPEH
jgi:hypothetical protein